MCASIYSQREVYGDETRSDGQQTAWQRAGQANRTVVAARPSIRWMKKQARDFQQHAGEEPGGTATGVLCYSTAPDANGQYDEAAMKQMMDRVAPMLSREQRAKMEQMLRMLHQR